MKNLINLLLGLKHQNASREVYESLIVSSNCLTGKKDLNWNGFDEK